MKKFKYRISAMLLALWLLPQSAHAAQLLVPVGQVIGLELADNTVTVAAFDHILGTDARASGLKVGDRITMIDETPVACAEDVHRALERSDGTVDIHVLRDGRSRQLQLTPRITQEGPRLGVYLRQGITGVGTVTWYDPETDNFGALGHGVNDQKGQLVSMQNGKAYRASILSVKKGKAGEPGQLMGALADASPIGTLTKNTVQGVFGKTSHSWQGQSLPVADTDDIRTGSATIRSTIRDNAVQEYSVEILKIYPNSRPEGRNMLLKVTDQRLLDTTGGIVQGMSGSPIIQDGKLIGAVTHVLVNDPTTGYGIFIENMLDAAA